MIHGDQTDAQEVRRQEAHTQEGFPESGYSRGDRLERACPGHSTPGSGLAPCTRSHVPNARTRKALRDADAGKNLTEYADADDLFRKLGIQLGQDKV